MDKLDLILEKLDQHDKRFDNIENEIKSVKAQIGDLSESLEETRGATNYLVEWVSRVEKAVKAK